MKPIDPEVLKRDKPTASCAGCGKEIDQTSAQASWVLHNGRYYCPSCARDEGLY
jgi:hypothetical protein